MPIDQIKQIHFTMVYFRKNRKNILSETSKSVCRYVSGNLKIFLTKFLKLYETPPFPDTFKTFLICDFTMANFSIKEFCFTVLRFQQKMACLTSARCCLTTISYSAMRWYICSNFVVFMLLYCTRVLCSNEKSLPSILLHVYAQSI